MVINYIILFVLVFLFVIINFIRIIYTTASGFRMFNETIAYWNMTLLVGQIFMCIYIFFSVRGMKGNDGPPGLDGPPGNPGKDGKCLASCGQKVCNVVIRNRINSHFKKKTNNKTNIKNKVLLDRLNKICFSKNYYGILVTKHPKRPNEKELIEYIGDLYINWIDLILKKRNGTEFLLSEDAQKSFFGVKDNPIDEMEKYDIWHWGSKYKYKPIVRIQCAKKTNKPSGANQEIYVYYTNADYRMIFDSNVKKNTYGPHDCPYNQLGTDFTNPRGLTKCYYFDLPKQNRLVNVYLHKKYKNFKKEISFFNRDSFSSENNQQFYPCGTIWRGRDDKYRTNQKNYIGPEKFTILISGRTQTPIDYELIWSNSQGCTECFDYEDIISIWRPKCPEGYVSLGDVAVKGTTKPDLDMIRVVKEEYVKEVPLEKKVWTEAGFAKQTFNSGGNKTDNQTLQKVSIWPIGYNVLDEERLNQKNRDLEYSGGYSLFRANNSHMKPSEKGYLLKDEFIYKVNTPGNLGQNTELGFGWLGGKPREGKYSVYNYLGITSFGIITNIDTEYSPDGLGKSYYIEHVKDNLYGIKALNPKSNLFEHYYQSNNDEEFTFVEKLSKTNPKQHWELIPIYNEKDEIKKKDDLIVVHLRNKENGKFFTQNYDSQGLNNESESDGSSGSNFVFQSYNGDIFN